MALRLNEGIVSCMEAGDSRPRLDLPPVFRARSRIGCAKRGHPGVIDPSFPPGNPAMMNHRRLDIDIDIRHSERRDRCATALLASLRLA